MVERITSRRSTLRTPPALREEALPRPRAQRMCCGVHTESSADRSEMGKIDRSRRRRGCAGALRHKICTASLDNRPLIDGFVLALSYPRRLPPCRFTAAFRGCVTCLIDTQRRIMKPLYTNDNSDLYGVKYDCAINYFAANSSTPLGQRIGLLEPTRHKRHPSHGERAMIVECQLGKLPAPEGHPESRLVPGVTEGHSGRKALNEGVSAR